MLITPFRRLCTFSCVGSIIYPYVIYQCTGMYGMYVRHLASHRSVQTEPLSRYLEEALYKCSMKLNHIIHVFVQLLIYLHICVYAFMCISMNECIQTTIHLCMYLTSLIYV